MVWWSMMTTSCAKKDCTGLVGFMSIKKCMVPWCVFLMELLQIHMLWYCIHVSQSGGRSVWTNLLEST
jgi:hypothetical protein